MQLTERCDVWGWVGAFDGSKAFQIKYRQVQCLRVPSSGLDKLAAAMSLGSGQSTPSETFRAQGRSATALFLVPMWLAVVEDNELRVGRRVDLTGTVAQYRYTVAGIRDYGDFGYQDTKALFCQRLQSG